MLRIGMFLADRYEILDQVGAGGMSDVYKAKCHKLNRFVAIKVLKQEFSQDKNFVSKFRVEAQSAAGLTHPNVVNVYDVGDENGIYYIVMELVEGITLKRYIEKKKKLSSKEAVSIAIQVAQGIEAAHSHHIIHRDIKPQNIIISKEGKVKVTDFGIARASSTNTINSSAMGSVHYISPEQARGGYSDERSDIYSFGITLYEMLTGVVPFDGDSTVSVAVQHIQDEIAPPSKVTDGIPVSVDKIVLKCTQKKTERRYQSATELITDLKKSLVMPDVDFVKMVPAFGAETIDLPIKTTNVQNQPEGQDDDMITIDDQDLESGESFWNGEENPDDILKEDEEEEEKSDDETDSEDDDEDIEDGSNEKLDKVVKWIGIGIVILIVIFTVFVAVKLVGAFKSPGNAEATTEATIEEESSTVNDANMVTVPSLEGKTEEEAIAALKAVGLGYKSVKQPSETVASGLVIKQSQTAGAKVAKNSTITLSISDGVSTFSVPSVKGMEEDKAVSTLKDAGLKPQVAPYEYSDTVAQGVVIRQTPASGTVKSGDTVTIVVSRGKENKDVTMVDVRGLSENDARIRLDALGLKVDVSNNRAESDQYAKDTVASQNYSVGVSVPQGTTITITLSSGPKPTEATQPPAPKTVKVPNLVKMSKAQAQSAIDKAGLKMTSSEETSDAIPEGSIISQDTEPDTDVAVGSTIKVRISSGAPKPGAN